MIVRTLRQACVGWQEDNAAFLGAALAYYALFSVAPLLLIGIAIAGLAFGEEAASGRVATELEQWLGREGARNVQVLIESAREPAARIQLPLVGVLVIVLTSLGMFRQLKVALNLVWKLGPPPRTGIMGWVNDTLLSLILVLMTGLLILFLMVGSMATAFLSTHPDAPALGPAGWHAADFAIGMFLQTLILVFVFRFLSDGRLAYRHLWWGALVAAVLLAVGRGAFALYLGYSRLDTFFGAAGSLVVFLVWIYYSSQIVFFGAEVVKATRQPAPA